jgi:hypothetical protein
MITKAQAIATILGIEISKTDPPYFYTMREGILHKLVGNTVLFGTDEALDHAIQQEIEFASLQTPCNLILLPSDSPRAEIYMEIEQIIRGQEAIEQKSLIDCVVNNEHDPREAVLFLGEILRECAKNVLEPQLLEACITRVAVGGVVCLQWIRRFLSRIIKQQIQMDAGKPINKR